MAHSSSSKTPSFKTPRAQVTHLGSARSGTSENWAMRVTSTMLIPLSVALTIAFFLLAGKDYDGAREIVSRPLVSLVFLASIGVGAYHMKLGMKSIILDYVHSDHLKEWALIVNTCFCYGSGLVGIYALMRIAFS